jgi:hypothetical protein
MVQQKAAVNCSPGGFNSQAWEDAKNRAQFNGKSLTSRILSGNCITKIVRDTIESAA